MIHQQDLGEIYMYLEHLRRDATISSIQIIAVVYFSRIDIRYSFLTYIPFYACGQRIDAADNPCISWLSKNAMFFSYWPGTVWIITKIASNIEKYHDYWNFGKCIKRPESKSISPVWYITEYDSTIICSN